MAKNTGIEANQLSDLDYGGVLKDAHRKDMHCLDVNIVNSLVPEAYTKTTTELIDFGDGTKDVEFINFYGSGIKNLTEITLRSTILGTYEFTTFPLTSETPASLAGKYLIIYDDVGSVGVWFNLDSGSSLPSTGADRNLEVNIATGDSTSALATKLAGALNTDSKFSGSSILSLAIIQSSTIGNKTNATGGNTTISPSIQDGADSINNKYLYLYSANDRNEYYLWFNYDGTGTNPYISGKTGIEITYSITDTVSSISQRIVDVVGALDYFNAEFDGKIQIQNSGIGACTAITDVNTGSTIITTTSGTAGTLVARIQIFFDSDNIMNSVERIV